MPHTSFGKSSARNLGMSSVGREAALEQKRTAIIRLFQSFDKFPPIDKSVSAEIMLFIFKIIIAHVRGNNLASQLGNKRFMVIALLGEKVINVEAHL